MSYFLGCDVCKGKLDVALINEQGVAQWYDIVPNETDIIASFLMTISGHYVDDEITCVVEATGCYHHPLIDACDATGVPCRVYKPNIN